MKERMIPLLMLVAAVYATVLFAQQHKAANDPIDKMQQILGPVAAMVPETSHISFQSVPIHNEWHFYARYALAPRFLPFHKYIADTLITICAADKADSVAAAYIHDGRKTLWGASEEGNIYLLTIKQ